MIWWIQIFSKARRSLIVVLKCCSNATISAFSAHKLAPIFFGWKGSGITVVTLFMRGFDFIHRICAFYCYGCLTIWSLFLKIIREVAHVHWNLTEICKKGDCWFSSCVLRDWSFSVEVPKKRWVKEGNHVALSPFISFLSPRYHPLVFLLNHEHWTTKK